MTSERLFSSFIPHPKTVIPPSKKKQISDYAPGIFGLARKKSAIRSLWRINYGYRTFPTLDTSVLGPKCLKTLRYQKHGTRHFGPVPKSAKCVKTLRSLTRHFGPSSKVSEDTSVPKHDTRHFRLVPKCLKTLRHFGPGSKCLLDISHPCLKCPDTSAPILWVRSLLGRTCP